MKPVAKGKTESEKFFLSKIEDGTLTIEKDGTVFNNKTERTIGATGSGRYPKISMKDMENDCIRHIQIHRLNWLNFNGDIPDGMILNHKDLNTENRSLNNLEITDFKGNSRHFVDSEKFKPLPGESNGNSSLLDEDVKWMREDYKLGKRTMKEYASLFGVHRATISTAIRGIRYKNVK